MANTKITSRVIADDAILTANIADDQITSALIADDVALGGNPTTSTQSAGNNTTRIATTAFVSTAVANIVNSAPATLDTLGEIATALNNDAALNTTLTNSIAAKLPLAGGTLTGALAGTAATFSGNIQSATFSAGSSNSASELLYLLGSGHTGHGASNTVSLASIAESTSGNTMGLWIGSMTNENTGVIGTRTATGNLAFQTHSGSWGERMRITYDGKVGIGTSSPSETLHVKRADGTALIVESSNDQNNTGDRINIEFRTDAAQGIAKIIGGKEGNYQGASTRSGYLAFQTINANSYAERMRINSSGFTSVSNDPNYIASDQAGLQVERGGLLIHGTSLSTNFHTANHHGNYWTFIGSAGASGSYAGNFRISVPNPEGTVGTAWGGLQLEIYISGYNAKFCHAILSGYTNGGVTLSESTIIRSSGSHSISYGNYHTAGGSSNQGFYFDVDIPAYVHPAVFFRITRAGDASTGKETSMKNLKIEWS